MFEGKGEAVADAALTVAKSVGYVGGVAVHGAALGANVALKAASETSETAVKAGTFVKICLPREYYFGSKCMTIHLQVNFAFIFDSFHNLSSIRRTSGEIRFSF